MKAPEPDANRKVLMFASRRSIDIAKQILALPPTKREVVLAALAKLEAGAPQHVVADWVKHALARLGRES